MKRKMISLFVFIISVAISFVPVAIGLTILNLYLSGHGMIDLSTTIVVGSLDLNNLLFILFTMLAGATGVTIYLIISKSQTPNPR